MFWKKKNILIVLVLALILLISMGGDANADYIIESAQNAGSIINTYLTEASPIPEPLSLWFGRRSGPDGAWEYWRTSRVTEDSPWESPINFGALDDSDWNYIKITPRYTTADGLELYFYAGPELPGYGGFDLWVKKRENIDDNWGPAENLGSIVNTPYSEACPAVSPDGLELYFSEYWGNARPGGHGGTDLWVTRRNSRNEPWGDPVNLGAKVNTTFNDQVPILLGNGLLLLFESDRPGGFGGNDLYMSRRATVFDSWTEPINLGQSVNSPSNDEGVSFDGSTLYFHSNRSGGYGSYDIWQASVKPIVDLDGNGMVDINDLVIMIENWDTNEPSCDIGPMPLGDGVVNRADLEILMEYWNQVVDVAAYYKLNEIEGLIAYDSSGYSYDANVFGDPNWQPEGGIIDGAIELDGINDFISTPFVLNPQETSAFSVFAWIKGGSPGQVILSQANGVNWLSIDEEGCLKTELKYIFGDNLLSEVVITDGDWHRVGFTWDGVNRILYVDDFIAAIDTQTNMQNSEGGLYIGAGKNLESGSFWSGLIDDVRIYNRVITP